MKFLIAGAGRVGLRTARILHEEGHGVTLVEKNADVAERARKQGFEVIVGDATSEDVLRKGDLETIDAFGGLTSDLNVNFASCMIADHYGCRTVMRIDEDYREDIYHKYADDVDEVIYPERLGAAGAKTALLGGSFSVIAELTEGLQLTTLMVPSDSPVIGQRVHAIEIPENARIYAHGRDHERMTIPLPNTTVESGDRLAVITDYDALEEVRRRVQGESADGNA